MAYKPKRGSQIEAAFQRARENGHAYEFLSNGMQACLDNAASLGKEIVLLASNGFHSRAQFVMAHAMEELGKTLILFDFARIPWDNTDWIRRLCRAFYDHLAKAGYAKTIYFPGSGALADALMLFKLELIPYWPNNDPESGEPDEYASGIVDRDWGLYVDWVDYDGRWFSPNSSTLAYYYAQEESRDGKRVGEERIEKVQSQLERAHAAGLFKPEALTIIHAVMSKVYVTTQTPETVLVDALEDSARRLSEIGIKLSDETIRSSFMCYPLYALLLTPEKIKGYWE